MISFTALLCLLFFFLTPCSSVPLGDLSTRGHNDTTLAKRTGASREVIVFFSQYLDWTPLYSGQTGQPLVPAHSAIQWAGNDVDGPIRVEIAEIDDNGEPELRVRATSWGTDRSSIPPREINNNIEQRVFFSIGDSALTNEEIFDSYKGTGLVYDVWNKDPVYRDVGHNCNHFVSDLAKAAGIDLSTRPPNDPVIQRLNQAEDYQTQKAYQNGDPVTPGQKPQFGLWDFYLDEINAPSGPSRTQSTEGDYDAKSDVGSDEVSSTPSIYDEEDLPDAPDVCNTKRSVSRSLHSRQCPAGSDESDTDKLRAQVGGSTEVSIVRAKGVLQVLNSFTSDVVKAAGVAGLLAAPVFIILDLINGDWQAASFAAVGLVAGIASLSASAGPIGVFIGAIVSTLFSILPGLFGKDKNPPSNNVTQIVQFTFFGDKDHTGNELCNKNRTAQGLTPNCSALYGPGVLQKVFQWETFDAIAFLVEYNDGYPMTIPDIVNSLYNVDPTKQNDGAGAGATVNCGLHTSIQTRAAGIYVPHRVVNDSITTGYDCGSPKFTLNRANVMIPVVNQTAESIYKRIIPAPGGDCKLVNDGPGGVNIAAINLTFTGRPAAISCGLTNVTIPGTMDNIPPPALPTGSNSSSTTPNTTSTFQYTYGSDNSSSSSTTNTTNTNPYTNGTYYINPANQSTDQAGGRAYVRPPAPSPLTLFTPQNAACLSGADAGNLCLPTGNYSVQRGSLGFTQFDATDLALPSGGLLNLTLEYNTAHSSYTPPDQFRTDLFYSNVSLSSNKTLQSTLQTYKNTARSEVFTTVTIPSTPPAACLFTYTQFQGDVACWGIGGANLTAPIAGKAQSIRVLGDATVWFYAEYYGDLAGASTTTDIPDLTAIPYGTNGNFQNNVNALWIAASS